MWARRRPPRRSPAATRRGRPPPLARTRAPGRREDDPGHLGHAVGADVACTVPTASAASRSTQFIQTSRPSGERPRTCRAIRAWSSAGESGSPPVNAWSPRSASSGASSASCPSRRGSRTRRGPGSGGRAGSRSSARSTPLMLTAARSLQRRSHRLTRPGTGGRLRRMIRRALPAGLLALALARALPAAPAGAAVERCGEIGRAVEGSAVLVTVRAEGVGCRTARRIVADAEVAAARGFHCEVRLAQRRSAPRATAEPPTAQRRGARGIAGWSASRATATRWRPRTLPRACAAGARGRCHAAPPRRIRLTGLLPARRLPLRRDRARHAAAVGALQLPRGRPRERRLHPHLAASRVHPWGMRPGHPPGGEDARTSERERSASHGGQAEHPRHLGRRHRHHEPQRYSDGLMGYRTPNIDRIAEEGMRFTDCYGEQSCTAGRAAVHHRAVRLPHRPEQGGPAGGRPRAARRGSDDRRATEAARLRHRPVRQEPPRRQGRVPSDQPRVRRVLRQPLPPERRGGAGAARLPAGRRLPRLQGAIRSPGRHPLLGRRSRDRPRTRASAGRGSGSRTPGR